jgi:hypothetical protein
MEQYEEGEKTGINRCGPTLFAAGCSMKISDFRQFANKLSSRLDMNDDRLGIFLSLKTSLFHRVGTAAAAEFFVSSIYNYCTQLRTPEEEGFFRQSR